MNDDKAYEEFMDGFDKVMMVITVTMFILCSLLAVFVMGMLVYHFVLSP